MPNQLAQQIIDKRDLALKEQDDRKKQEFEASVQRDVDKAMPGILARIDGSDGSVMLLNLQAKKPDERENRILDGISEKLGIDLRTLSTLGVVNMNCDSGGRDDWWWAVQTAQMVDALRKS